MWVVLTTHFVYLSSDGEVGANPVAKYLLVFMVHGVFINLQFQQAKFACIEICKTTQPSKYIYANFSRFVTI